MLTPATMASSTLAAVLFIVGQYAMLVGAKVLIAVLVDRGRGRLGRGYTVVMKVLGAVLLVFAVLFAREAWIYMTAS